MRLTIVTGCLLSLFILFSWSVAAQAPLQIEIANESGVVGYQVSVFGTGFGDETGSVSILGKSAEITLWTSRTVQAIVPPVADGIGDLAIETADGQSVATPFTVYSINPDFLLPPTQTYKNVLAGRQAVIEGFEWSYCAAQPENEETKAELFLSNYRCGYRGIVRSGLVVLMADSSLDTEALVAYRFSDPLEGEHVFQFVTDNNWYERSTEETYLHSVPETYHLEISADSTNGTDGTWQTLLTIESNNRSSRTHSLTVPDDGTAMWFRMRVTDGLSDHTELEGRDFALRELRLFEVTGNAARPDAAALYGDSLSADAFEALGPSGLPFAVNQRRGEVEHDVLFTSHGLAGQNSSGLVASDNVGFDIFDAFTIDDAEAQFRYWLIAIGTNDAADGQAAINTANTNLNQYAQRLDQFVRNGVARGVVPIVARIPDTDSGRGGWGDLASKRHVLSAIDATAARYGLIPGPDFYAEFRLNIETDESSFFGDDGVHHVDLGGQRLINGWAETLVNAFTIAERAVEVQQTIEAETAPTATPAPQTDESAQPTATSGSIFERAAPTEAPIAVADAESPDRAVSDDVGTAGEENSAESSRPIWIWIVLFGVLVVLSFVIILFIFKRLGMI